MAADGGEVAGRIRAVLAAREEAAVPRPPLPRTRYLLGVLLFAAVYVLAAKAGLAVASLPGNVAAVWPPSGLAVGVLLVLGARWWPGVLLGAVLVNAGTGLPWSVVATMAVGNTAEAVVGSLLVLGLLRRRPDLRRVADTVAVCVLAAGFATVLSATAGVGALAAAGVVPWAAAPSTWFVWWMGDCLGVLILTPALVHLAAVAETRERPRALREGCALVVLVALVMVLSLTAGTGYPYLVLPVVAVVAVRLSPAWAALCVVVADVAAVVVTALGHGTFVSTERTWGLAVMDTFLGVVAVTTLVLAAVVAERDQVGADLARMNAVLDRRVQARTAELEQDRQRLRHQARHDALTGLGNRVLLGDTLRELLQARRRGTGRSSPWSSSTWTGSRSSTTGSATPSATTCCSRSPTGSPGAAARSPGSAASGATSSWSSRWARAATTADACSPRPWWPWSGSRSPPRTAPG